MIRKLDRKIIIFNGNGIKPSSMKFNVITYYHKSFVHVLPIPESPTQYEIFEVLGLTKKLFYLLYINNR